MSWRKMGVADQRAEFAIRALRGESLSALCREFSVTRPTGYLWLRRFEGQGVAGLEDLSRRPRLSPSRTPSAVESRIVSLRAQRPDWGARKLAVLLEREGVKLPVITVHRILLRHGLVLNREGRRQAVKRFERGAPNELWQMDFKGQKGSAAVIGPLSVLDDHSRYLLALRQLNTTRGEPVQACLQGIFEQAGVPEGLLMDHGVPWWSGTSVRGWTQLSLWLMKQGIRCYFSGVRHPQTQGKVERFHGALENARDRPDGDRWLEQSWLDAFRQEYNHVRPHQALAMKSPASFWKPSDKAYDPNPPAWEYEAGMELRKVNGNGTISVADRNWIVSQSLAGERVRIERVDQRIFVFFCKTLVREIELGSLAPPAGGARDPKCKECPDNDM